MDDRILVQKLIEKDVSAERIFFETYRPRLRRIATFILGYRDMDVEDVLQETFLMAFRDLPTFEFRSSLFHWLRRICVFRSYDRIRKRKWTVASLDEEIEAASHGAATDRAEEADEEADRSVRLGIVRAERERMEKRCREILDLRDEQGKNYAEIVKALSLPVGTVMSRLARCKETLKQRVLGTLRRRGLPHG